MEKTDPEESLRARLDAHLASRTHLTETLVGIGETTYYITHPAAAEALIDEEEFARDERIPYWAELWPSAVALARRLYREETLPGRRVIELGCGVGLPCVVALSRGASRVVATDYYRTALDFASFNAATNLGGRELEPRLLDWHERSGAGDLEGAFDLVLAADVLYESRNVPALAALIPMLLAPGGEVLLADPGRKDTPRFLEAMGLAGFVTTEGGAVPSDGEAAVLVYRLRRG